MSSDGWPEVRVADFCDSIDYGYTQSASDEPVGPKFLRITDIVSGPIDWGTVPFCEAPTDAASRYRLDDGDIVVARTGATTGTSAYIQNPPDAIFASYLVRLRVDRAKAYPRFVAFFLKSPSFWDYIRGVLGDKSAQPNASAKTMTQARLRLPPLAEQRRIADTLGALDDKIELNRQVNRTLESIARATFKSWFVDFGPGRKGMGGGEVGLPPDLGMSSQPWSEVPFSATVEILSGGTPSTGEAGYWGGAIPWYSVADAPSPGDVFVTQTEKTVTREGIDHSAAQVVPELTTIISARGTVGRCALTGRDMAFNQSCFGMRPANHVGYYFTYFSTLRIVDELRQRAHGSVFSTITRPTFASVHVPQPPADLVAAFERRVRPLMMRIRLNVDESRTLQIIRDSLLPRLIGGELPEGVV